MNTQPNSPLMACHGITETDTFTYLQQFGAGWHGLGRPRKDGVETAVEALREAGADWQTEMHPVTVTLPNGNVIQAEKRFAHVRMDTETVLEVLSKTYKPLQNITLAEIVDEVRSIDPRITVDTLGTLFGGRRIYFCCRLPLDIEVVPGDNVQLFLVASNTHDGTGRVLFYLCRIRVVCRNTQMASEAEAIEMHGFTHKGDMEAKAEEIVEKLRAVMGQAEKAEQEIRAMASTKLTTDTMFDYFRSVYDATMGAPADDDAEAKEKRAETIDAWNAKMGEPNQTIDGIEGTLWAAYNAVTEWSDHDRGRFKSVDESEARQGSNLFGASAADKQVALQKAVALATN